MFKFILGNIGYFVVMAIGFGLVDKRYKEKSFIWWQILIGLIFLR